MTMACSSLVECGAVLFYTERLIRKKYKRPLISHLEDDEIQGYKEKIK